MTHHLHDLPGGLVVHCAANGHSCAEHLLACSCQGARAAAWAHDAGNLKDVLELDVPGVLHVLDLCGCVVGGSARWVPNPWGLCII